MVIIWLPLAEKALEDIFLFYEEKSLQIARKIISDIQQATKQLVIFPEMAAIEHFLLDRPETFRSLVVRQTYKIVYFIKNQCIYIADIWDCRQNPTKLGKRVKT